MGYIVDEIIKLAQSQVGYCENPLGSNHQKYSQFFDTPISKNGPYPWFNGKKQNVPYCAIGICWLLCMVLKPLLGSYDKVRQWLKFPKPADNCAAGCPYLWQYLKARFKAVDKKSGVACDVIFFNAKCTHVGLIEYVKGGKYHTIEFNCDNGVRRRSYAIGSSKIYGIIHMDFSGIEPKPEPPEPTGTTYKVVTKYQHLEVRKEPTTKSADIGDLAKGSTFTSSVVVKGESVHGCDAWVGVNGGYANGYYLSPTPVIKEEPKPEEPTPVVVEPPKPVVYPKYKVKTVTGEWLALRVAPKTGAVLIERMPYGSEVELIDTVSGEKVYGSNEWARVRYTAKNGTVFIGYCIKSRLKKA